MRKVVLSVFSILFMVPAIAADVVCACPEKECSTVTINFVPSNPGVYMTVEYAYGDRNTEGFATVTRDEKTGQTIYRLGTFTLVEKDKQFKLPGRDVVCN